MRYILGLVLCSGLAAQGLSTVPLPQAPRAAGSQASVFEVSKGTLQDLASLPTTNVEAFEVQVLLGTKLLHLRLRKHEVRAAGFQLLVQDGKGTRVVATPACVTYRGDVARYPNSIVSASLVAGRLAAMVRLDDGQSFWGIQPVTGGGGGGGGSGSGSGVNRWTHITYDSADNIAGSHRCGTADDQAQAKPTKSYGPMSQQVWVCDIACDADYDFYQQNGGSVTNTQNDITSVINNVAAIYKKDVAIDYKITTIIVRTSRVYATGQASVAEMRTQWLRNHGNVPRDVAHLFTGRSLGGSTIGVAYVATICSTNNGYGVSRSRYTSNMTSRTALTCHELGHGWSSPHCDNNNPCNIMCAALGGCSKGLTSFGTFAQNYIVSHRNTRTCLTTAQTAPVLSSIQPTAVPAFPPGSVTLVGTGFTNVDKVNVGSQSVGSSQIQVLSDTKMTFTTPLPTSLLPAAVTAEIQGSKSNSLPLYWNPTSPPRLVAYSTVKPGGTMFWEWGAGPGNLWFLTLGLTNNTTSILGFSWLDNAILVTSGSLNAAGLGAQAIPVPSNVMLGLKVYSQVVTLDPNQGAFAGNTNVTLTTTTK